MEDFQHNHHQFLTQNRQIGGHVAARHNNNDRNNLTTMNPLYLGCGNNPYSTAPLDNKRRLLLSNNRRMQRQVQEFPERQKNKNSKLKKLPKTPPSAVAAPDNDISDYIGFNVIDNSKRESRNNKGMEMKTAGHVREIPIKTNSAQPEASQIKNQLTASYASKLARHLVLFKQQQQHGQLMNNVWTGNDKEGDGNILKIPWEFVFSEEERKMSGVDGKLQKWAPMPPPMIRKRYPPPDMDWDWESSPSIYNNNTSTTDWMEKNRENEPSRNQCGEHKFLSKFKISLATCLFFTFWLCVIIFKFAIFVLSVTLLPWVVGDNVKSPGAFVGGLWGYCLAGIEEGGGGSQQSSGSSRSFPICASYFTHKHTFVVPGLSSFSNIQNMKKYFDTKEMFLLKPSTLFEPAAQVSIEDIELDPFTTPQRQLVGMDNDLSQLKNHFWPNFIEWFKSFLKYRTSTAGVFSLDFLKPKLAANIWAANLVLSVFVFVIFTISFLILYGLLPKLNNRCRNKSLENKVFTTNVFPEKQLSKSKKSPTTEQNLAIDYVRDKAFLYQINLAGSYLILSTLVTLAACLAYPLSWGPQSKYMNRVCGRRTRPYILDGCSLGIGFYLGLVCVLIEFSLAGYAFVTARKITIYRSAMKFKLSKKYMDIRKSMWGTRGTTRLDNFSNNYTFQAKKSRFITRMNEETADAMSNKFDDRSIYSYLPNNIRNRPMSDL